MGAELRLKSYQEMVDARLEELLPPAGVIPRELHDAMRYACLSPGKRLRPGLCLAAAEAVNGNRDDALDAACAIEMVHAFSLVHDDLPAIDNDDLRRGRPTCHVQFGEAVAILAGDALFALAFQTLVEIDAPALMTSAAVQELARASGTFGLVGGEVLDIMNEGKSGDLITLKLIHSRKTGSLIAAGCVIGGLFGGGSNEELLTLREFGECAGLAFQIADDILNEVGTSQQLGKAAGSDKLRRKLTYPSILGIEGAKDAGTDMADKALAALGRLPGDTSGLRELAHFSVSRDR